MLLDGKVAIIFGAGSAIGGAVGKAFAREGARVFLSGRDAAPVKAVANDITAAGGVAETATVDALDETPVIGGHDVQPVWLEHSMCHPPHVHGTVISGDRKPRSPPGIYRMTFT